MSGILTLPIGAAPVLVSRALVSNVPNTENALVQVELSPLGILQTTEGGGGGVTTNRLPEWWGRPFASSYDIAEGFQANCFVSSGNGPNGVSAPVGPWIDMNGASVLWQLFRNTVGTFTGIWVISIRSRGTTDVLATANFTMTATKNP